MGSTIALMLASLVSLSAAQAPPPAGAAEGPALPYPGGPPPLREGLDLNGSFLLLFLNKGHLPPLFTTSAPADRGRLGAASTQTLFGGSDIGPNPFAGGRFSGSVYATPLWDAEVGGFFVEDRRTSFVAQSGPNGPLLAIPTIDANTGQASSVVIADPGVTSGAVSALLSTRLWGLHAGGVAHLASSEHLHLTLTTGVRYAEFDEIL